MAEAKPKTRRKTKPAKEAAEPGVGQSAPPRPPPATDAPPRPKGSGRRGPLSKEAQLQADLTLIEAGLSELLVTMPGMAGAATNDRWLVDHVTATGPNLAHQITAECARNETLRRLMLTAMAGESVMMTLVALFAYAAPMGMHFGLLPGGEKRGIPTRAKAGHERAHEEAKAANAAAREEQLRAAAAAQAQREAEGDNGMPPAEAVEDLLDVGLGGRPDDLPPAESI